MRKVIYIFLLSLFVGYACHSSSNKKGPRVKVSASTNKHPRIYIQPFADLPDSYLTYISTELKKNIETVIINPRVKLPLSAFYKPRQRYRADSLLRFLRDITQDHCHTLGLTTKDISTSKGRSIDWGVMGLGYCPGKSCIASSFRLKGKNKLRKLYKVAIHELGHTEGLPHCKVKMCYMRDAEGHDSTDDETGFCANCQKKLIQAGWKFN